MHLPHGPPILVERLLRIERSELLIDLLLQSISCCSLLFTSNVAGRLLSACSTLPRSLSLSQSRRPIAVCMAPLRRSRTLSCSFWRWASSHVWLGLQQVRCGISFVIAPWSATAHDFVCILFRVWIPNFWRHCRLVPLVSTGGMFRRSRPVQIFL